MPFELAFWEDAARTMDELERGTDPDALAAVLRTLAGLEIDAGDRRLRTRQFDTPRYGHIRMTPCGHENWHVYWQVGQDDPGELEVVAIGNPSHG